MIATELVPFHDQQEFLADLAGSFHDRFMPMVHYVTKQATGIEFSFEVYDMVRLSNGGGYVRPTGRTKAQGFVDATKLTEQFRFSGHSGETGFLIRDHLGMVATYIALQLFDLHDGEAETAADAASRETVGVNAERLAVYMLTDWGPFADQPAITGTLLGLCHGPDVKRQYLG